MVQPNYGLLWRAGKIRHLNSGWFQIALKKNQRWYWERPNLRRVTGRGSGTSYVEIREKKKQKAKRPMYGDKGSREQQSDASETKVTGGMGS